MRTSTLRRGVASVAAVALLGLVGIQPASARPTVPTYTLSVVAGTGSLGTPTAGTATSSALGWPAGVTVDASGNAYVADFYFNVIEKIAPTGELSIVAGNGLNGPPTPGPATSSALNGPTDVAVDASGNLYIADKFNLRVEKVATDGTLSVFAGNGSLAAPVPGPATDSPFWAPVSIAVDASGNVYVADKSNRQVVKITAGGTLSILAGNGTDGAPTPGPATDSAFSGGPSGVAVDASGNVYISDNTRIMKVVPDGTLSIIAGTGSYGTPTAGPATNSSFNQLTGIDVDSSGNLYVGDWIYVEKITSGGTLSVIAGTGDYSQPVTGYALASPFQYLAGIAVDASGTVYGVDWESHVVVKLSATTAVAPSASSGLIATAGDRSATISFTPGSNGGSAVTKYQYKVGTGPWTDAVQSSSPITVTGLTNYTTPQIRLRAVNAVGAGASSTVVTARPRNPGPVLDSVSVLGDTSLRVGFTGVTIGGANLSGYTAYAYTSGTDTVVSSCRTSRNGSSCDITGLTAGTNYDVRVINYFKFVGSTAPRETLPSNRISATTTGGGGCRWCD